MDRRARSGVTENETEYLVTFLALAALLVFVWSCGGEDRGPPVRVAEGDDNPPTRLVEEAPVSTMEPALPSSMASTTIAAPESDGIPVAMARPSVSYLEDTVPPCTPIVQGGPDPCESELSRTRSNSGSNRGMLPDVLPTISKMVHNELSPALAPHCLSELQVCRALPDAMDSIRYETLTLRPKIG